jgi:hypothetical protein
MKALLGGGVGAGLLALRGHRAEVEDVTDLVGQNPTDRYAANARTKFISAGSYLEGLGFSIAQSVNVKHP